MKKFIFAALAAVVLSGCTCCNYESVKGDPTGARIYTLDNGLKIYTLVNKDLPRIDAQIAVKVGSKNDPRETTGLAHYFEHLMFKGTSNFGTQNYEIEKPMLDSIEALFEVYRVTEDPAIRKEIYHKIDSISYEASKIAIPNEYDKLMASMGAKGTNAYTSQDVTCYVENIPSNQIENWARVQADRFSNCVIRGFHTELETIYEEFNMYNAMDNTKEINALFEGLFPKHPYNTDVIGLPSHLKNPSITNVKNYYAEWYVPNNMAIVLAGDFKPAQAVRIIKKYFGKLKPNENLKKMEFEPEDPICEPVVKTVIGNEAENMIMGWRFPAANSPEIPVLEALGNVLFNGKAGLIDLDVNQKQKALWMYAGAESLADYSIFIVEAQPVPGQTLDQVRDLALAEIDKVKKGEFDESLLEATINNLRLSMMRRLESSGYLANIAVDAFFNDIKWEDQVNEIETLAKITKQDIVDFANKYFSDNYVYVKKLQGKFDDGSKIDKPAITPIFTNRDTTSLFLLQIQSAAANVKPIKPSFVDFNRDMQKLSAKNGLEVLAKKNETNEIFNLTYRFEFGRYSDPVLGFASQYIDYLGTSEMSVEEINTYLYKLAANINVSVMGDITTVSLSGLEENREEVMEFVEKYLADLQPNPEALEMLKANTIQEMEDAKTDQSSCSQALSSYCLYGPKNPVTTDLTPKQIMALTDEELIAKIKGLFDFNHSVLYYGPDDAQDLIEDINEIHSIPETFAVHEGERNPFTPAVAKTNTIFLAPFDANQSILTAYSCDESRFDLAKAPVIDLYNNYFGRGMNGIVFQEMREARGLAYSAYAMLSTPRNLKDPYIFTQFIQTQNDKLIDALTAFKDITDNMPVSPKSFGITKDNQVNYYRTSRTTKMSVINAYLNARELGLKESASAYIYNHIQNMTIDDVVAFQQENIKDRNYNICILGRIEDFDKKGLSEFGDIRILSLEDIFGY